MNETPPKEHPVGRHHHNPPPMTTISNPEGEMLHQGCCLTSEHRMPSPRKTPSSITR
jgi:hypothetical protein